MLPRGKKLDKIVPKEMYSRLEKHLERVRKKIPQWTTNSQEKAYELFESLTKNWKMKRPIWILIMLNQLTEKNLARGNLQTLDMHLAFKAKFELSKETGSVEKVSTVTIVFIIVLLKNSFS